MPHQCTNCGHVFDDGSKEMLSGCPDCGGNKFQYHPGDVPEEPSEDAEPPERESGSVSGAVGRAANKVRDAVSRDSSPERDARAEHSKDEGADASADDAPPETSASADVSIESASAAADDSPATEASTGSGAAPETGGVEDAGPAGGAVDSESDTSQSDATAADSGTGGAEAVDASTSDTEDTAQASARSEVVDRNVLPDASEGRVVKEPDDEEDRPDLEALRQELNDQFESIRIVAPGQYELNLMELYDRQEYIIALQEDGQYVIEVPDAWDAPDPTDAE
ncbi:OapC/ArvC family zinc-ribbon domain-containing protein [Halobacterium litoreum]|uniref:Zn-ribbon containing protein n=1 Tax=Halobacterium litoreum TaxID=2039234 RepID=A0ABD5NF74_9EURY|nr:Zn-ribbon containing protein [Halobacterium litoreum]UHH13241.1 hypothetical protein LT972_13920 [Halobacterium litoreum]